MIYDHSLIDSLIIWLSATNLCAVDTTVNNGQTYKQDGPR